ncbi:MAG: FAD-dependent oxidoreductase [Dehalococcoidia bacterium]|nr:FAD-dependent oxidoreductase [Dehalococcoidia bacterium]MDD5493984.1 FAD-dependent oxidoreductase [Dehalococcoidia bacterium]
MEKKKNILIIGGGACGPKTAARARRLDSTAQITMVQDELLISYAACGLPYYVSGAVASRNSLLVRNAAAFKKISNVDVLVGTRVNSIDRALHKVNVTSLAEEKQYTLDYDKLVIATGANPVVPPIKGIDLQGIHILKRIPDADEIINLLSGSVNKKAVIVGAGLIGMEMAEALVARGIEVTIVEALERILPAVLDAEIADLLANHMKSKGVTLKLGQKIVAFEGEGGRVRRSITDKESIEGDVVILSIGVRPDSKLAREAGLDIGTQGDILVNEYLQTSDPDIYAGGDCVANINLVTGQKTFVPMGSTANKHGHVIAANITGGKEKFPGVIGTACVKVFDFNTGRVGLSEKQARDAGYEVVTAMIPGPDKPDYYPGSKEIILKLIVDAKTRRILGGQGTGPGDVIKRIDVLAASITMGMTVDILSDLDLAYAPPYNTALDVLHHLANLVRNKLAGRTTGVKPADVKDRLDKKEDFVLLDVRSRPEWEATRIEAPQALLLPQPKLPEEMDKLPRDKEIVVMCRRGGRAYQACCTLKGAGFKDVKFMEGSLTCWCDDVCGRPVL